MCTYNMRIYSHGQVGAVGKFVMALNAIGGGKTFPKDATFPQDEAAPQAAAPQFDRRTRQLIEAPITPTLLRLAAPNVLVMVVQASVGLIETYFVGKLGTDALAGGGRGYSGHVVVQ